MTTPFDSDQHFDRLLDLVEMEREAEKEENKRELEKYPLQVRENLGKTVTKLTLAGENIGVGGLPLITLYRPVPTGSLSFFHAMNQGDNVQVTFPSSAQTEPIDGTLYDVDETHVVVALNKEAPEDLPQGPYQIDLLGSDATYKRMRQALNQIARTGRRDLARLRHIFLGKEKASKEPVDKPALINTGLNAFQKEAVEKCMAAQDAAIIHGPPGTGKTTVLVEVILQAIKNGQRVLASAPSNIAVDNMVEKLIPSGVRIVRLGHPARVLEPLHHVTLAAQQDEHPGQEEIRFMDAERARLSRQLRRKTVGTRGTTFRDRNEIQREINQLWKSARDAEFGIRRQIIKQAQVVLSTHGGIGGALSRERFDLVVLDEASQATEPLSWIPIVLGGKVILAGDANQLPPTIYSKEAASQGLSHTLFDRLKEILPESFQTLLRFQYRMHEQIMEFPSLALYEGKLIADESVARHTAAELDGVKESALTNKPVLFIDTAGTGYEESWNELLESRENEGELGLTKKVLEALRLSGIQPHQIALLTPYVAQVKRLRVECREDGLEIGSIDSFQGREKEVIILGLVRSNEKGEVGFLSDIRRMNVGMTRARRLLIVIGDSATIGSHPFYKKFLDYVEKIDAHASAWEWMN